MRKVLFITFFALMASAAFAQDPVKVDTRHYKVMFENDQVRVLRIHYNPKEKSVMHEHPAAVVVFLNTSKAKFTLPDGSTTTEGGGTAGSVRYTEAGKHLPEDIGATPIEAVLVELKSKSGSQSPVALDPVKVDPARHKVEMENDQVRVLRIKVKGGETTPMHEHPNGVAVFITDNKTKFTRGDGTTRESSGKRGGAIWAAAEKHTVHNMLARPFEVILVELK
jgi:quercetin dioxygenase-like cupin family protein